MLTKPAFRASIVLYPAIFSPTFLLTRWSEVITHVPGGISEGFPPGRLRITAVAQPSLYKPGGRVMISAPSHVWEGCRSISAAGYFVCNPTFLSEMESEGVLKSAFIHQIGHILGIGCVLACFTKLFPQKSCIDTMYRRSISITIETNPRNRALKFQ